MILSEISAEVKTAFKGISDPERIRSLQEADILNVAA